ncbi:MAG TPA: hypothetical protein VF111_08005 [Thermoanaerobaculia bacterium]
MRMPLKALVCGSCKGYQDWRRRIPGDQITLALMVAIFSLVGSLVPLLIEFINLPSQTSGFFLGMAFDPLTKSDERSVLTVRLTNEGGRAALATGGRIAFDLPELASIDLEIVNRNGSVVPPEGSTDVNLFVHGLKLAMPAAERTQEELNSDKEKLAQRLCTATAHLFVGIRERTRIAGTLLPAQELEPIPVPIFTARTWVLERVVGVLDPEKEICP